MNKNVVAVALISGGLDSAAAAALAQEQGWDVLGITVNYGQRHVKEIDAAERVADALNIPWHVVEVPVVRTVSSWSALTNPGSHEVPMGRKIDEMSDGIPITYVPMRNTILMALAAAHLESTVLRRIKHRKWKVERAGLVIGANAIDYSGYPDCRPEYYKSLTQTLRLGSSIGTEHGINVELVTPVIGFTKADVIREGHRLGVPVHDTWSCYIGAAEPCGECDSCKLRDEGFRQAGLAA